MKNQTHDSATAAAGKKGAKGNKNAGDMIYLTQPYPPPKTFEDISGDISDFNQAPSVKTGAYELKKGEFN